MYMYLSVFCCLISYVEFFLILYEYDFFCFLFYICVVLVFSVSTIEGSSVCMYVIFFKCLLLFFFGVLVSYTWLYVVYLLLFFILFGFY